MSPPIASLDSLIARVRDGQASARRPYVVALDGPSGAGKSTIADALALALPATIVPSDDFFAASIPTARWDAMTPAERAAGVLDWPRLREALESLRAGRAATWYPFDFQAGAQSDGSYRASHEPRHAAPAEVILLEGAYTAGPQLADLVDFAVLVLAPPSLRQARLAVREEPGFLEAWYRRWGPAESHYFSVTCPPSRFDAVVSGERQPPE